VAGERSFEAIQCAIWRRGFLTPSYRLTSNWRQSASGASIRPAKRTFICADNVSREPPKQQALPSSSSQDLDSSSPDLREFVELAEIHEQWYDSDHCGRCRLVENLYKRQEMTWKTFPK